MKKHIVTVLFLLAVIIAVPGCNIKKVKSYGSVPVQQKYVSADKDISYLIKSGTSGITLSDLSFTVKTIDLTLVCNVPVVGTMQGIAYSSGYYYAAFDMGSGNAKIAKFTPDGTLVSTTGLLKTGHSAEIAYRNADGRLYVSDGAPSDPAKIYVVDMNSQSVTGSVEANISGYGALVCINNDSDTMIVSTNSIKIRTSSQIGKNETSYVSFYTCDFTGKVLSEFRIPYQGIPQGIECYNGKIYFYTNNKVIVLDKDGDILESYNFVETKESEGLTIAEVNGSTALVAGYNTPNRLYALDIGLS